MGSLFDYFVGAAEKRLRHVKAERLGGLEIDDQLGIGGLLDRRVSRILAPENAARANAGEAISVRDTGSVTHEAASRYGFAPWVYGRNRVAAAKPTNRSR